MAAFWLTCRYGRSGLRHGRFAFLECLCVGNKSQFSTNLLREACLEYAATHAALCVCVFSKSKRAQYPLIKEYGIWLK